MLPTLTALLLTAAAPQAPQAGPDVYDGRRGQLRVSAPRLVDPDISIDGRIDEPEWGRAAVLQGFTQYEPSEGIPSTEPTEVRVFYTGDAIYFGVRALDSRPDLILGRLGERDTSVFGDDWVRSTLATFDDQRQAYVFYVNPLGIQTDGLWIEGLRTDAPVSIDFNPDFIWESSGRVTDRGWEAEFRIPYVSLRFREVPVQDWGFNVLREVRRRGFKQSWAPLTQNVSSTLAQSGRLVGLRDLRPRRLVEINPVVTGAVEGSRNVAGEFERSDLDDQYGVNARLGITSNLVLDATVNPDFSQVEADVNQITVNERFALFFPEKRPFFLEGAEVFRTPKNLVHTRQIADPIAGGKLSGKLGPFALAYLGALDEGPGSTPGEDADALFNLVRARSDIGAGSTVGVLYTDRTTTEGGGFNRVLSADARVLFGGRYTLTTQLAGSWIREQRGTDASFDPLFVADFARSGRRFGFQVKLDDVHPGFRTESGFIPRIGDTEVLGVARYSFFGTPGAGLERVDGEIRVNGFWDHDRFWDGGTPFEREIELWPRFHFRGGRQLTLILRSGYFRFDPANYASYERSTGEGSEPFGAPASLENMLAVGMIPAMRINNQITLRGNFFAREIPIFSEASRGLELQAGPTVQFRPTSGLQFDLSHTYSRIWRDRDDSVFSTVNLSRLRTQFQFSRSLFVRALVQYDMQDRDALLDPTGQPLLVRGELAGPERRGSFDGQFLVSYEPSPGTIFFAGYNRVMRSDRLSYRISNMELTGDGLFVKLSYLFRL